MKGIFCENYDNYCWLVWSQFSHCFVFSRRSLRHKVKTSIGNKLETGEKSVTMQIYNCHGALNYHRNDWFLHVIYFQIQVIQKNQRCKLCVLWENSHESGLGINQSVSNRKGVKPGI